MQAPSVSIPVLAESKDILCLLDAERRFVYCNPAWDRFAAENKGATCTSEKVVGAFLLDGIPDPLVRFFQTAFEVVRDSGEPFEFDYECSSSLTFRMFRMRILPVSGPGSFLVIHSLRVEKPHDRAAVAPDDARYRSPGDIVVMCCHCRRTRRAAAPDLWDWVPDYVAKVPPRVSAGICPACYAYFYPDIYARRGARPAGQ